MRVGTLRVLWGEFDLHSLSHDGVSVLALLQTLSDSCDHVNCTWKI